MIIPAEIWQGLPPALAIRAGYRHHAAPQVISHYQRVGYAALIADLPVGLRAEVVTIQGPRETVSWTAADEPVVVPVPGVVAQVVSLVKAGAGLLSVVAPEVAAARLATCEGCDLLDREKGRCRGCGCFVQAKAQFGGERCPQGKWIDPRVGEDGPKKAG